LPKKIVLKLILCGEPAVGKTSLIKRYVDHSFTADYKPVMGVDITSKDVKLEEDGREATISIHDLGGQRRWDAFRDRFYKGAHLAMFVYDLTRPETLDNLVQKWIPEFLEYAPTKEDHGQKFLLVGNKADLTEIIQISKRKGTNAAKKSNAIGSIWTSAKDDLNVEKAFIDLIKAFLSAAE
jgi:small GTP-binding protein